MCGCGQAGALVAWPRNAPAERDLGTKEAPKEISREEDGKLVWADYKASTDKQAADVLKVLAAQK